MENGNEVREYATCWLRWVYEFAKLDIGFRLQWLRKLMKSKANLGTD